MKWKIIHDGYKPSLKCGAEVALGVGAGIASLAGSLYSNDVASSNVGRQLGAQSSENQLNRDWQTSEAEKARQFNASQQQGAFGQVQQLQSRQQQYNLQSMAQQAQYNSPVYQRQQLEKAGINPQVYFGSNSAFGGSSASSGGSPSAPSPATSPTPSGVSGLSPVSYQPRALDVAAIGSAMKSFAEAKKLGVETDWLPRTLQADIMNKKSYSDLNSVLTLGARINNEIQNAKVPYSIKQAAADLARTVSECKLNESKVLTEESLQKVNASIESLNQSLSKLNNKEYERYGIFLKYYENQLQAGLANLKADTGKKLAETQTEDEIRQWRINLSKEDINKVRAEIKSIDINNKATAIESLRKLTGLSDAVWNDIWNKIKLKTGAVNREALEKYLFQYDLP